MTPPDRRRFLATSVAAPLAALVAAALPTAGRAQAAFDLVALMQLLGTIKSGEATFTETRRVEMLERSLQSSGKLSFESPDSFVRETLKPRRERIAVVGDVVTMSQGSHSRTVTLDSVPEAAVIVEAIRGTLTGNRDAIERNFSATVTGNAAQWTLELVPRMARLRELVVSVRVGGTQALVREVIVAMSDGDRSVMSITPTSSVPR
ncbi:MAG TPA: outer membrane lipoprotein carrier protein LolA [Burkholderiaceae bacterium]|jgi:outer membrane lipoprotein-sorting protein